MATLFGEVTYRTTGEDPRVAALDRLDALPALPVSFERHRALGVLERDPAGISNFESRRYQRPSRERYATVVRERCEAARLEATLHIDDGDSATSACRLSGRIRGAIDAIESIAHELRTPGHVPFGRAEVKYL